MRDLDQNDTPLALKTAETRLARYLSAELTAALCSGRPRDHDLFLAA